MDECERKEDVMKETWTRPEFEDVRVSAECTSYAGTDEVAGR
jgi:coenzyme PQQ precursor peptide PqqA